MSRRLTALSGIATAGLLAATMGTAAAQTTTACGVAPAGYNVIEANTAVIVGTSGRDFICAGDGNNTIRAKGSNDIIHGGAGNDIILAGAGDDVVHGGEGDDLIRAGRGKDLVRAGSGKDRVIAGSGADVVRGGNGNDELIGNKGSDSLFGDAGNDTIDGGSGTDTINGGPGNDGLSGGSDDDKIGGGAGDDDLFGNGGNDRLGGGSGEDTLVGGSGDDTLVGGSGPDVLRGSNGSDDLDGGNGLNVGIGGDDNDACLNVDSPLTDCEIIDGIDDRDPRTSIEVMYPLSGPVTISGRTWSPNTDLELSLLPNDVDEPILVTTNANGEFETEVDLADIDGKIVQIFDGVLFHNQQLEPVLDSFTYDEETTELTVVGPLGKTVEAFVYDNAGALVFVEQMSFDGVTSRTVTFQTVDAIGRIDINTRDSEGDREVTVAFVAAA